VADNEIIKRIKHRQENQGVQSYNLGGKHLFSGLKLDYEGSYSRGNENTPYEYLPVFGREVDEVKIDRSNTDRPKITGATLEGNAWDWNDDGNYKFIESEHSGTTARSQNFTGKFNAELPWNMGKNKGSIKFGAKARGSERINRQDFFHLYEFDGDDDANPSLNTNQFTEGGDRSFKKKLLGGDYLLTKSVEWQNVHNYIDKNRSLFSDAGEEDLAEEVANRNYKINENVYAGYLMGTMNFNKFMLLGGLRYEYTDLKIRTQYWDEENEVAVPANNNKNYAYLLPMLHLKYEMDGTSNVRFAATTAYSRPNFVDYVSDDKVFSESDKEAYIGNADLKPVTAVNLDLMYEKYYGNVGILSGGLFYKHMNDFIYVQTTNGTFNGVDDIDIYQSVNGNKAEVAGIELSYQRNLTFLPGFLKGLGVYANYTYTTGSTSFNNRAEREDVNGDKIVNEKVKLLPGQSKHISNIALSYNKGGFSGRITANYNSKFISEVGTNSLSDIYVASRWQFDASFSQRISKNFRIYLEGVNLSNASGITYVGARNNPYEFRKFGMWARFGIKFDM
jgi:TonB-dependent receptor